MNPTPKTAPPAPEELDALLRLLDDETPEVRQRVAERLALCGGDISEWLASRPQPLDVEEQALLAGMLSPPRRKTLEREWMVPTGGATALHDDWDSFEALLRAISDFLHDGITVRQPLSDALDLMAEEAAEAGVGSANELRAFLLERAGWWETDQATMTPGIRTSRGRLPKGGRTRWVCV